MTRAGLQSLIQTWIAPLFCAALIGFFGAWWGDHVATAQLREKVTGVEQSAQSLQQQNVQIKESLARQPEPEQVVRKDELLARVDSMQRQLDSIEHQVAEIRQHLLSRK